MIAFHCRTLLPDGNWLLYSLDLGWSGVDLFFVLSGFLITGILLDTRDSPSYFRTFYARRALRIFPLYFAYILVVIAVTRPPGAWWYLTYLMNWKPGHGVSDPYLKHLWSLAIEEQFYLVWPAVVFFTPPRRLARICGFLAVAALACRALAGMQDEAAYRLTFCRMDALGWGALTAIAARHYPASLQRWTGPVLLAASAGFLEVVLLRHLSFWNEPLMRTAGASLIAIVYVCLVASAATRADGAIARVVRLKPFRICGKYSYAMYVLQLVLIEPVGVLITARVPATYPAARCGLYFAIAVAMTLSAAWISWRVLEEPFHRWKDRFPYTTPEPVRQFVERAG